MVAGEQYNAHHAKNKLSIDWQKTSMHTYLVKWIIEEQFIDDISQLITTPWVTSSHTPHFFIVEMSIK